MHCFLKLFYDAGILDKLFLTFRKVMHMPQFDGYHHFPVDIHSINCVKFLENIENDLIKNLYEELSDEERLLLKIAVLFHDAGKGRKQDHSEVGAKLIVPLVKRLGLSEESVNRTVLLIRHHILMSSVAFKENIHNEKTLYTFMSYIQNTKNLKLLYILTYADINGVGGDTYNSFNSKLLLDLYKSALEVSENANRITDASKRINIEKKLVNSAAFKELPLLLQKKILRIESNLFFFSHTIEDIVSIALQAKEIQEYSFNIKHKNFLTIEIFRKIPLNIGYLLASLSRLDVGSMEILTLFDDVKYFKIEFIKNITEEEKSEVEQIIANSFDMQRKVQNLDIIIKKEEVSIDCEHSLTHAEISVQTSNQRGLLAHIMSCFEELSINIVTAKIHSSKHRVKDTFLMEKQNDICNNTDKIYRLLTK
jgi:[protein-PII] uridylyltransferase